MLCYARRPIESSSSYYLCYAGHTLYHYIIMILVKNWRWVSIAFNLINEDQFLRFAILQDELVLWFGWRTLEIKRHLVGSSYSIICSSAFLKSFRYHRWTPQKIEWHFINDLHEESVTLAATHKLIFCNCAVIIRIKSVKYLLGPLHWIKSLTIPEKCTRCFNILSI